MFNEGGSIESSIELDSEFDEQEWKNDLMQLLVVDYGDYGQTQIEHCHQTIEKKYNLAKISDKDIKKWKKNFKRIQKNIYAQIKEFYTQTRK